jgi:hypothetical protein
VIQPQNMGTGQPVTKDEARVKLDVDLKRLIEIFLFVALHALFSRRQILVIWPEPFLGRS